MLIEERLRLILAAFIITFSWVVAASAFAQDLDTKGPIWLWSESVPLYSSAAEAFGAGDYTRGLRLTHEALAAAEDKRDRLIAHHNLCVAYATRARTRTAIRHCQETRRLAEDGFVIADNRASLTAAQILDTNLAKSGNPGLGSLK